MGKSEDSGVWQNRIVGHDVKPASWFLANEDNWRIHARLQGEALTDILSSVGWVAGVLVNLRSDPSWKERQGIPTMVDGHLRVSLALREGEDTPVLLTYTDLMPPEEAFVLATFDPIGALAVADKEKLDELLREVDTGSAAVQKLLDDLAKEAGLYGDEDQYSRKIEAPIYRQTGEKPSVCELFDDAKTQALARAIQDAEGLTEDDKKFLTLAAQRHTVLNFHKIAEYYAHADANLQRLMEDSALVIIDFNRAIELGYVKLSQEVAAQYKEDYPDA